MLGAAVAQAIDFQVDARRIGFVEALDPGGDGLEVFGFPADHEDRVEPRNRLEFDQILAQPGCVGMRFYYGLNEDGIKTLVYVGIDADGKDIVKRTVITSNGDLTIADGIFADRIKGLNW